MEHALDIPRHIVNLSHEGTLEASGQVHTPPEQLERIVEGFAASGKHSITLHFHGGLVSEAAGMQLADDLFPLLWEAGTYPVFVVWETGPGETVESILRRLYDTPLFRKLARKALKFVVRRLGAGAEVLGLEAAAGVHDSVIRARREEELGDPSELDALLEHTGVAPETDEELDEIAREIEGDPDVRQIVREAAAAFRARQGTAVAALTVTEAAAPAGYTPAEDTAFLDADVLREAGAAEVLAESHEVSVGAAGLFETLGIGARLAQVLVRVVRRLIDGSHHGVWPTIVEETLRGFYLAALGAVGWDAMKRRAAAAYRDVVPAHPIPGGTRLMELLGAHAQALGGLSLNLVGHSAGAIHIGHFLEHRDRLGEHVHLKKVVLFAPACDFELFQRAYLSAAAAIEDLRLFVLTDEAESKDPLIRHSVGRHIYPRSLLYLVSGVLEGGGQRADHPLVGMQRFLAWPRYAQIEAVARAREFLAGRADALTWCPGPTAGFALHGGMFEGRHGPHTDPTTLQTLKTFLAGA